MVSLPPPREYVSRTSLPGNQLAASAGRRFVRAALAEWTAQGAPGVGGVTDRLVDDAVLLTSELVTNAVMHAGTNVDMTCRWAHGEDPGLVVEVADHHPARLVAGKPYRGGPRRRGGPGPGGDVGRGLALVGALSESWGVTYHRSHKAVWFRLDTVGDQDRTPVGDAQDDLALHRELRVADILAPAPMRNRRSDPDWINKGSLSFLAEASDLLAGQLDEDMISSLAGQLLVPRLADWCAVWLTGESEGMRLARVWHCDERRMDSLRLVLEKDPPPVRTRPGGVPWPWPEEPSGYDPGGAAVACPLVIGGRCHGTLVMGRAGIQRVPDEVLRLVEDLCRRVALAVGTARRYTRQAMISRVLQRGLLPSSLARIPGVDAAVVYEPTGEGYDVGGDFYDLFPAGDGRWCFALGDVCGNGPEAASVTGLARHVVRLLAREGYGVADVLDRLNRSLVEEGSDPGASPEQPRFLSLLYGELVPDGDGGNGALCTLASAGHPLPLLLRPSGEVRPVAAPQMLLGITEDAEYVAESFDLAEGETLLCVTDGVTERRRGNRQLDDDDGLRILLGGCAGLGAHAVAEKVRRAVHEFDIAPIDDDLALLVLQAMPQTAPAG